MFIIFITGCKTKSPEVTPVTTGLEFVSEIKYLNEIHKYKVNIDRNGNMEMRSMLSPNIDYLFTGGKVTVTFDSITHETELSTLSNKLTIDLLYSVFNSVSKDKTAVYNKEKHYIKGNTNKYFYTYTFGMTGLPIKITEENFGVTVMITDCSITKPN